MQPIKISRRCECRLAFSNSDHINAKLHVHARHISYTQACQCLWFCWHSWWATCSHIVEQLLSYTALHRFCQPHQGHPCTTNVVMWRQPLSEAMLAARGLGSAAPHENSQSIIPCDIIHHTGRHPKKPWFQAHTQHHTAAHDICITT